MKHRKKRTCVAQICAALAATVAIAGGCSKGTGTSTSPSSGNGPVGATITITSSGVTPKNVTINNGEVVTFVNGDTRNHEIASNPHLAHTDCPPINALGILTPGQTRNTGTFTTSRTCGFHDHLDDTNTALQGTITIR